MRRVWWLALPLLAAACVRGDPQPVATEPGQDACRQCRMIVTEVKLTAQIVRSGEEPIVFDDIGCLRAYVGQNGLANGATAYVADHWTGDWIRAEQALYTKVRASATPMGSGLLAHRDRASRQADPAARDGDVVALAFGGEGKP